ncbi:MAG: molybdenum cofactor guanylyltransferase [Bacteroidales bacterium]|nr:molybdenum cofactor guanylyltransferase [Bacteroidales bacterium]
MEGKLTGIILAGGQSRRMGMEKGLVIYKSQPLIHWSVAVFKEICDEILISSNSDCYRHLGFKVVPDIYPDCGPMGGIYSCLKNSTNDINLVLSCDMPFVTNEIFDHLLEKRGHSLICVPWHEQDMYEPLCGVYHNGALIKMNDFITGKNYKLPDLFKNIPFMPVRISEIEPPLNKHYFLSINSPNDLELARQLSPEN